MFFPPGWHSGWPQALMWTSVTFSQCCVKCYANPALGRDESTASPRSLPHRKFWSLGGCLVLVALHGIL